MLGDIRFTIALVFLCLLAPVTSLQAQQETNDASSTQDGDLLTNPAPFLYADEQIDLFDESTVPPEDETANRKEDSKKPFLSFLDSPQKTITSGFDAMLRAIDEFFANEDTYYESSGSYIRYTIDHTWSEGNEHSTQGDLKIRVKLPLTERKLKFTIESDPEEQRSELDRERDSPVSNEDKSFYAGFERDLGDEKRWQLRPSIGVRVRSPLDYYVRLRAGRKYDLSKNSIIDFSQTLYWFDSTGYGADTNFHYNYRITDNVVFRSSSFARYTEEYEYWDLSQNFYIAHKLSEKRALLYQAGVFGISEPTVFATDYLLLVRYRQNIHKDWLFFEITPQILYQEEFDFKAEHSVLFRLEVYFIT